MTGADSSAWRHAVPRTIGKPSGGRLGIIVRWPAYAGFLGACHVRHQRLIHFGLRRSFGGIHRSAIILGVMAAAGIGLQLVNGMRIHSWAEVGFLLIIICFTVCPIEQLSKSIRRGFI